MPFGHRHPEIGSGPHGVGDHQSEIRERCTDAIDAEVGAQIDQAVDDAKAAPLPTEADLLTDVYVRY